MNIQTSKIELAKVILDIENPKLIEEIIYLIQSKSTLTEKQKIAITLIKIQGMKYEEAGAIMGLGIKAIESSVEALSATKIVAILGLLNCTTLGKNFSNKSFPFQFKITTAILIIYKNLVQT